MKKINYFCIYFILHTIVLFSNELPPIVKFSPSQYNAGNQNWMVTQDSKNFMFFANNNGLLEFNGSEWATYTSPNETIIRSVKAVDDKIYTGCYMEFGYWKRKADNTLKYYSLSQKIKKKIIDDEQFWNILNYENWIIFQSLNQIFIYNTEKDNFKIIKSKNGIIKSFLANETVYFQVPNEGLYEIIDGNSKLVCKDNRLIDNKIVNIFNHNNGLLIQTQNEGIYFFKDNVLNKFYTEIDDLLKSSSIYSCEQLLNGDIAIGTISNGIYVISIEGKLKFHINQKKGLTNNTILSLFEDKEQNLWLGLDNGINCLNLNSFIKTFSDQTGILGTVYCSEIFNNKVYIGTNQGLFYKNLNQSDDFQFISGTKGQVWSLFKYKNTLFCGHDSGTFIVNENQAKKIFNQSGTWKFQVSPKNENLILQGNYTGISVLEKNKDSWTFKEKIKGFEYSSRFFEITSDFDIYVSHEYKGIFKIKLNQDLSKVVDIKTFTSPSKGKNSSLVKFRNNLLYTNKNGVYKLDRLTKEFKIDSILTKALLRDEYISGKLVVDQSDNLWMFTKNYIHYFTPNKINNQLKEKLIPISASITNSMPSYENITQVSPNEFLVGTVDGYYTLSLNDFKTEKYNIEITKIQVNKLNEASKIVEIDKNGNFKSDVNNIIFHFTVPEYNKYVRAEFQYILEGFQDKWSEWNTNTNANFKNLPPGDYTFKVRTKIANKLVNKVASYSFYIAKPWYLTNLAKLVYLILALIIAFYIHKGYKIYYRKKEQKLIDENNLLLEIKELENEQKLIKLQNEKLSKDVSAKSKELAASTMSLMKKKELLSIIK
ncbi:MAG: LuxR family transcriptional regulator [Flavobacterium sp.]|nr:LuxR family transcriptional regulator [Flavobacterium sp.]